MSIVTATDSYEAWLAERITIVQADLDHKHRLMTEDPFVFLRATFYRWAQKWPEVCKDLAKAPEILAVGDIHSDNFGSWRDVEARLVWGMNDFDEAFQLPYTNDLVRLCTSISLALQSNVEIKDICKAVLKGYRNALRTGGRPFVVAEDFQWLGDLLSGVFKDAPKFWDKLTQLARVDEADVPGAARNAIKQLLPKPNLRLKYAHRVAGVGSLGRLRFVALAKPAQALAAREAKELTASSALWALEEGSSAIHYNEILDQAVRSPDPFTRAVDRWLVRRLSPDYVRIDLESLAESDLFALLDAMGQETANIHLGNRPEVPNILSDLKKRNKDEFWLADAASRMEELTYEDYYVWVEHMGDFEVEEFSGGGDEG